MVLWIGFDLQAEIEAGGDYNSTALHYAAIYGKEAVAAQLLQAGSSVSAVTNYDQSPLHLAALLGKSSIANLLLKPMPAPRPLTRTAAPRRSVRSSTATATSRRCCWRQSKPQP